MYRIKKITREGQDKFYPQVKGCLGWSNVYYDFYFEELKLAVAFLDEHTNPEKEKVEIISYENPKARARRDYLGGFLRMFMGD
jgi:hypothetical protein